MTNREEQSAGGASLATLVWTVPVRIIDVSRSGCRLEATRRLNTGTSGRLRLALDGRTHHDDVRVVRCQRREGAGENYSLGAELLVTRRLCSRSIRLAVARLVGEEDASEQPPRSTARTPLPDRESEQQTKGVSRAPPATVDAET